MSLRVAITPDAAADILNARAWYDSQETGVGDKFYFAFQKRINKVLDMPLLPRAWGIEKSARCGFQNTRILHITKLPAMNCGFLPWFTAHATQNI
jgi:hypothetical protein